MATNRLTVVAAAVVAAALLLRAQVVGAPIMGSDEYAYSALGRFPGADLHALDPGLQRLDNQLTFALQRTWAAVEAGSGARVTRVVHVIEWVAVAAILALAFQGVVGARARRLGTLATLLLPSALYVFTVLPETELVLLAALLTLVMISVTPRWPLAGAALGGGIAGVALLVKPHAVAWVPAALSTLALAACFERGEPGRGRRFLAACGTFLAGWYAGVLVTWRVTTGGWSLDPTTALGLRGGYGPAVAKAVAPSHVPAAAVGPTGYALAHLVAIALLFAPAVFAAVLLAAKAGRERRSEAPAFAGFFALSLLVAHVAMAAVFTSVFGSADDGEKLRIHGRYLGPALVLLPFLYFHFFEAAGSRAVRWVGGVGIGAVAAFALLVRGGFRIYPWDYPELFGFFTAPNASGWSFSPSAVRLGWVVLAACLLGFVTVVARPGAALPVLSLQLFLVLLAGDVQVQRWLNSHTRRNRETIRVGEAVGRLVAPSRPGDGLVVGDNRQDWMSYLLFALGNAPRVLVREPGAVITSADAAGARWVLAPASYDARFAHRASMRTGGFSLFLLDGPGSPDRARADRSRAE